MKRIHIGLATTDVGGAAERSDKVWAVDADGHSWEIFFTHEREEASKAVEGSCCAPDCCT